MQQRRSRKQGEDIDKRANEFDQKVVEVKRVTRVVAGGKRMRFRALVVIGDRKGKVGLGLKKGRDFAESVSKAASAAKKALIVLPLFEGTIPHALKVKYKSSQIILKPAKAGTGVIAGGAIRAVMDLAGVKNVSSKMLGSSNKVNNVKAVFEAFKRMTSRDKTMSQRKAHSK